MTTLDLAQAATLLKVHPKTLQRMARGGLVPSCKVGRAWVFVERLLLDYLEARSLSRVCASDLAESEACLSTGAKTLRTGGSSSRPFVASRSHYSKALGLPTSERPRRSTTVGPTCDGSRTA
jgi:hypothetical protein